MATDGNGLYYMRTRYYNTDIRRFINQDIITGSIENSRSLNRYAYVQGNPVSYTDPFGLSPVEVQGMRAEHLMLKKMGFLPAVGTFANAFNAYLYYKEGNKDMAKMYGIMAAANLFFTAGSMTGTLAGSTLQACGKTRAAAYVFTGTKFLAGAATFNMALGACADLTYSLCDDIKNGDFGFNSRTFKKIAMIGFMVFTAAASGEQAALAGIELGEMIAEDTAAIAGKVKEAVGRFGGKIKGGNAYKGGNNSNIIPDLSNKAVKHPMNDHMPTRYAKQLQYISKESAEKYLSYKTFFNPNWTDEQVREALNVGYKEALNSGVTTGTYSFMYLGENVTVCLEDSVFKTGYGDYVYTYDELLKLLGDD